MQRIHHTRSFQLFVDFQTIDHIGGEFHFLFFLFQSMGLNLRVVWCFLWTMLDFNSRYTCTSLIFCNFHWVAKISPKQSQLKGIAFTPFLVHATDWGPQDHKSFLPWVHQFGANIFQECFHDQVHQSFHWFLHSSKSYGLNLST